MAVAWVRTLPRSAVVEAPHHKANYCQIFSRFISRFRPYAVNVGIPEFLKGVGQGLETHMTKLETEIGDFDKLLVTRTLKLKKLGIPCKHRKLILRYCHMYRLGLWKPLALPSPKKSL